MSTQELKTEIQRAIENAPDEVLNELLTYLRLFQNKGNSIVALSERLRKIIDEDKALLEKLAQ